MSLSTVEELMRISEVMQHATQRITVIDTSAQTGAGLKQVAQWVQENAPPDEPT